MNESSIQAIVKSFYDENTALFTSDPRGFWVQLEKDTYADWSNATDSKTMMELDVVMNVCRSMIDEIDSEANGGGSGLIDIGGLDMFGM